jgi:hypothetical protein
VVTGTAAARPRGTIVRSGWNCPGEPAPTAPLLISANPGCSLQIASALAERGQDIAVAHTAEVLDASIRDRPLLDWPTGRQPGPRAASGQNRSTVLAVPSFSPGVNKVVPNVSSSALAAAPVRVRTIPLIRT